MEINNQSPEGIYFGMPEEQYFSLPYFSRSLAETVLFDLEETKHSIDNPMKATPAMDLGTAIHSMFLEPETFDDIYIRFPKYSDFYGKKVLKTIEDIKPILKAAGKPTSGKKEDLIERVREFINPAETIIWEDVLADFEKTSINKRVLKNEDFDIIEGLKKKFDGTTQIKELLKDGYPEVVIIWKDKETGVLCKCRLDWLRPEAIVDVKSFSIKNKPHRSLYEIMANNIKDNYYNLQFSIYNEALDNVVKAINSGKAKIYGKVADEWKERLLKNSNKQFFVVFFRTAAPFQMKAIELEKFSNGNGSENNYHQVANDNWRIGIKKYARALKSGNWKEKEIETLDDIHIPNIIYQTLNY